MQRFRKHDDGLRVWPPIDGLILAKTLSRKDLRPASRILKFCFDGVRNRVRVRVRVRVRIRIRVRVGVRETVEAYNHDLSRSL